MNIGWELKHLLPCWVGNIPCRPLLSKKLLRLNSVFLEARYCINLCKKKKINKCIRFPVQLTAVQWTTWLLCYSRMIRSHVIPVSTLGSGGNNNNNNNNNNNKEPMSFSLQFIKIRKKTDEHCSINMMIVINIILH